MGIFSFLAKEAVKSTIRGHQTRKTIRETGKVVEETLRSGMQKSEIIPQHKKEYKESFCDNCGGVMNKKNIGGECQGCYKNLDWNGSGPIIRKVICKICTKRCSNCNNIVCPKCRIELDGKIYCMRCNPNKKIKFKLF